MLIHDENSAEASRESFLRKHGKKLSVLFFLVVILSLVLVDALAKSCVMIESNADRVERLLCDGVSLNRTSSLPFICEADDVDASWRVADSQCEQDSGCLAVGFESILDWISKNPGAGFVVIILIYAVATTLLIPGSILTIGAGVAFGSSLGAGTGTLVGGSAVLIGATIGSITAFLIGRYVLRECILKISLKYKVLSALDTVLQTKGLQVVILLRLSPIIPFNIFNFVMGSTSCSFKDYFLGTVIGIIPGTFAFVFIGAAIGDATSNNSCDDSPSDNLIRTIILVVGIICTIVAVVIITIFARKEWTKLQKVEHMQIEEV